MIPDENLLHDGELIAGPFRPGELRRIEALLKDAGVLTTRDGRRASWTKLQSGHRMQIAGDDVMAYFVDSDGIEVSETDLDCAILATVTEGVVFRIQGHHMASDSQMLVLNMTAVHDGESVTWSGSRSLVQSAGKPKLMDKTVSALDEILRAGPRR